MAGVWSDLGVQQALDTIKATSIFLNARIHLYVNNVTPTTSSTLASFTEATFTGYAALALATIGASGVTAHVASAIVASKTFTITAGTATVYGWYVTNAADSIMYWAERDPSAPITMDASGLNSYTVTMTISTKDQST